MATPKKTISDVSKPGNTVADPGSRPVIITKKDPVVDTVVNKAPEEAVATAPIVVKHTELRIRPMSEQAADEAKAEEPAATKPQEATEEPAVPEELIVPPAPEAEPVQIPSTRPHLAPISDMVGEKPEPAFSIDSFGEDLNGSTKKSTPAEKKDTSITQINEYIAKKTYFVPIGKSKLKSKQRRRFYIMLFLIVVVALFDIALYLGYVDLPF